MEQKAIKLNAKNLSSLPKEVIVPAYDRAKVKTGIVHVGIGGFHRAHQAFYTDQLLAEFGVTDWGICGIALLNHDKRIYDTLVDQDGLYSLMITEADGSTHVKVIGSIVEYLFAPENPDAVIEKMAHPDVKIITLTITEGGYNFNPSTGQFMPENQATQADIVNPENPATIFGYLTQAIKRRKERGLKGITIQSCDNIQQNGVVAKEMLLAYITLAAPELLNWVEENISFPNAMVDRITPVTSQEAIDLLDTQFKIADAWPVVCEPFCQWIIEDDFINGRPDWNLVGAQFVKDVHPYEKMKIRLVNGGHVALGFTGYLNGYTFVYETMADPVFFNFVKDFLNEEVTSILDEVPGINVEEYKETLMQRFSNPYIKDQLTRIFSESSAKIPKFLMPTINDQLAKGVSLKRAALILAAWCHYLAETEAKEVQDDMKTLLIKEALESINGDPLAFLKIISIFGDIAEKKEFSLQYLLFLNGIRKEGVAKVISLIDQY
jgi:mannitol 2-dehydrogenase